jgi:glycosidase
MNASRYPSLYQVNTRVWLTELGRATGVTATLDDIPDAELDRIAERGFDWVWFLSVWQTGPRSRHVSLTQPDWVAEYRHTLPDLREDDIPGSGFAIADYRVHHGLGGDEALARLRERLRQRGLKLMLDFVPNHMGLDHPWIEEHPEHFIPGDEADLTRAPRNHIRIGDRVLAHGRDPYFPGWPDTLQLNYGNEATREAMAAELLRIAGQCDGVRCDMAMLILPDVFEKTWGIKTEPFWPTAIGRVRDAHPDFTFMAEVYWGLEWTLQQQGFDYTYDKSLYDRLHGGFARPVREHLWAGLDYQTRLARFLENHDEPRAAATFGTQKQMAAAVITYLTPGMRFFHQGQFEGRVKRIPPHLGRGPAEPVNLEVSGFYDRLLGVLRRPAVRQGEWRLLECGPAWEGNWSADDYLAFVWEGAGERLLAAVNFAAHRSQCYVRLPFTDLPGAGWRLTDLLSSAVYDRDGDDLHQRGLYLDESPWTASLFSLQPRT